MVVLDFTGRYKEINMVAERDDLTVLDMKKISGCSRYCDEASARIITEYVGKYPAGEPFYLDNGNYHYISCLRAAQIKEEFDLLLIDHHTDAQEPMFPLLSCGGWVLESLKNNSLLNDVYMIGPGAEKENEIPETFRNRIHIFDENSILSDNFSFRTDHGRPLFVSIDLDVLSPDCFTSVWDQGSMSFETLKSIIYTVIKKERVCGIDICG